MTARLINFHSIVWTFFAIAFGLNYLPNLKWMVDRWTETESYTSHGPLIPLISAWLMWIDRRNILANRGEGTAWGLALFLPSLLVHLMAGLADVSSIAGFSMIPLLMGFVALMYGWRFLRQVWFPIFFLIFFVPPPEFVISTLNFSLKLIAADAAEFLLNVTGVPAIRQGSFMLFEDEKLAIGDVCSGLRSLLSLFALSVLYAWLIRGRGKLGIAAALLTALPAAIIGNGVRICLVCYLVLWLGKDAIFTPFLGSWDLHLVTGAIIFAAAMCVLWASTAILDKLEGFVGKKPGGNQ